MSRRDAGAASRREFLKSAGVLVAATACAPGTGSDEQATDTRGRSTRASQLGGAALDALGEAVLPATLGAAGQRAAVAAFVAWCDGYDPVAEEMHGYGYADIRYLPPDPAPAWRAQLDGLDVLARRVHHAAFTTLSVDQRRALVRMATRSARGERLPSPLSASHVAIALVAHWASSPNAWNLALGVDVSPTTCRPLDDATRKPGPRA